MFYTRHLQLLTLKEKEYAVSTAMEDIKKCAKNDSDSETYLPPCTYLIQFLY